ncbi:MAG: TOBE domain-containing protein, partial [Pseudomonadota bacterium]
NLDAKLRVQMRLEIRKLQQRLGVTSIYVTHDQVEAMTLGDRLMVLNGGYVEQFGPPTELYQTPATTFVAGFIGSPAMNLLPVSVQDGIAVLPNGAELGVETNFSGTATLGIRPEHKSLSADGPFSITVAMLEKLGANTLVHGALVGSEQELVASLPGLEEVQIGETLSFGAPAERLHLFDDSGTRIN